VTDILQDISIIDTTYCDPTLTIGTIPNKVYGIATTPMTVTMNFKTSPKVTCPDFILDYIIYY
jgi:hypothetical protein